MLKHLLKNSIQVIEKIDNWEESIKIASQPLLERKSIDTQYIDAMICNIKKLGPYVILMPGIAMPHASPEDGVNKISMALLKLEKGVSFSSDRKDINLIFILAARDSNSHMEAIVELADLLGDDDKINKIKSAINAEIIYNLL